MDVKINFIELFKYIKYTASYLKTAIGKAFTLNKLNKQISLYAHKTNILSKVIKSHTWTVNSCFIVTIIILCLLMSTITYYEQSYKFKQQLIAKTELAHSRITETITSYYISLISLGDSIIRDKTYLESKKILQLLDITYSADENIRLMLVTWHPLSDPSKTYSVHGEVTAFPGEQLITKLNNNNTNQFLIDDQTDKQDEPNLIISSTVVDVNNSSNEKKQNLIGYLTMSVKASLILQPLYYSSENDDLLKISQQDKIIYFNKQKNIFHVNYYPSLTDYQFANEISFSPYPYKIAVGKNTKGIIVNTIQAASLRCGIIIIVGAALLLIYNRVERKKALNLCNENERFIEKAYSLQQQVQGLTERLDKADKDNEKLSQENHCYKISASAITTIERQIHQGSRLAIGEMRDHNNLLVKHCNQEQVLDHKKNCEYWQ